MTVVYELKEGTTLLRFVFMFIKQLIFVGENYNSWPLWFLLAEIYALIVFRILSRRFNSSFIITIVALILWTGGNLFTDLCAQINMLPSFLQTVIIVFRFLFTSNGRLFTALLYIVVGGSLRNNYFLFENFWRKRIVICFGIVGGGIRFIGLGVESFAAVGTLMLSFSILIVVLLNEKYLPDGHNVYRILRTISMSVYFIHMYIWMIWYVLIYHKKTYGMIAFIVTATISIVVSLVYAWFECKLTHKRDHANLKN